MLAEETKNDTVMKKLVIIIISLMCVGVAFARKENNVKKPYVFEYLEGGGVRFHIEDKELPKSKLKEISGRDCWEKILSECGVPVREYNIRRLDARDSNLVCFDRNACFEGFLTAFDKHYSLVLSPDMIMLLISQGIATYINWTEEWLSMDNAERLRDKLVDFEGQKTLTIVMQGDLLEQEKAWDWIIPAFCDSIDKNMKTAFSDLMVCDFSTTGMVERMSSQITMMESVKKFFKYKVIGMGCGIPDITLLGTPDDWRNIRSRLSRLDDLELGWWREKLEPVLDEFVKASEGNINRRFWLDMVNEYSPERKTEAFCGSNGIIPAEYNGWFTVFFPFTKNGDSDRIGRTPIRVTHNTKVSPEIKKVDVLYVFVYPDGREEIHNLELWAGFIGMEMDWENRTLKPSISWMMREKSDRDMTLSLLDSDDLILLKHAGEEGYLDYRGERVYGVRCTYKNENTLFACRFPTKSMLDNYDYYQVKDCKTHLVVSLEAITVPSDLGEWCRKYNIENLIVKAPVSDAQKEDILRQFPTAVIVQL